MNRTLHGREIFRTEAETKHFRNCCQILDLRTAETCGSFQFILTEAERKNIHRLSATLSVFDRKDRTCRNPTDFEQKNWTSALLLHILAKTERQNIGILNANFEQKTRTLPAHRQFLRKHERQNITRYSCNFGQKHQTYILMGVLFRQRQKDRTCIFVVLAFDRQTEHPSVLLSF